MDDRLPGIRVNYGGNYCGHDPACPRLLPAQPAATGPGGLPRILTLLTERLADYYHQPRKFLPSLDLANGSTRQQRSERREGCIQLLGGLLKFCDLASLRVGIPTVDGFVPLPMELLAEHAGLNLRRAERAAFDLKVAGILTVAQPRERDADGNYRGLVAIRAISKHLFGAFGLGRMLERERKRATKRLRDKAERAGRTLSQLARVTLALGGRRPGVKSDRPADPAAGLDAEQRRRWQLRCIDLMLEHPDWDGERVRAAARVQLE